MWIVLFVIVITVAICLSVAAVLLRDRDATTMESMRLPSKNKSVGAELTDPDLKTLLASPEVRLVMQSDHVDQRKLLAELNATSGQLKKNARSTVTFDRAVFRLRNMSEMMDRLGLDAETLARTNLNVRSVFRACQTCPADEVCHDWLVRAPKSFRRAPAFCPNAKRIARARLMTI